MRQKHYPILPYPPGMRYSNALTYDEATTETVHGWQVFVQKHPDGTTTGRRSFLDHNGAWCGIELAARKRGEAGLFHSAKAYEAIRKWRAISDGIPPWTDDKAIRVIVITAEDDFDGVQIHDIPASDFHAYDEENPDDVGTEVTKACTYWAYRDDLWPLWPNAQLVSSIGLYLLSPTEQSQALDREQATQQAYRELQQKLVTLKPRAAPAPTDPQG